MGQDVFSASYLQFAHAAHDFLARLRWPDGITCPHCKGGKIYKLNVSSTKRRVLKCAKCRKQFSATVGTIFEDSHIPLTKWLTAIHLMCASKKGINAHQLHRMLGITYKSAWFMAHRIRHAMKQTPYGKKLGGIVEADETYIGGKHRGRQGRGSENKTAVFSLIQRGGTVRSFTVPRVTAKNLKGLIREHVNVTHRS